MLLRYLGCILSDPVVDRFSSDDIHYLQTLGQKTIV